MQIPRLIESHLFLALRKRYQLCTVEKCSLLFASLFKSNSDFKKHCKAIAIDANIVCTFKFIYL